MFLLNILKHFFKYSLFYVFGLLLLGSFPFIDYSTGMLFISVTLWIIMILVYRLHYSMTIVVALILLCSVPVLLIINQVTLLKYAEMYAIWVYVFLFIGTIQMVLDFLLRKRYTVTCTSLFREIWQGCKKISYKIHNI